MSEAGERQRARARAIESGRRNPASQRGDRAEPATFRFPVRVYYEDTDAAGIVYYANYLKYMERARTEWLTALGFDLAEVEREHGVVFVVHRVEIEFSAPAQLSDRLDVTLTLRDLRRARLVVDQAVMRGTQTLTDARVTLVCLAPGTWRPARIPVPLQQRMEAYL